MSLLAYVATTNDVLEEGKDKRSLYVLMNLLPFSK